MKIAQTYSHLNGIEFLKVHHPRLWTEIRSVILSVDAAQCKTKESKEKTMKGRMLYAPKVMNAVMTKAFAKHQWDQRRVSYWVTDDASLIRKTMTMEQDKQRAALEAEGKTPIYSYNQTDFVKNRVAVEVQFGKYSFVAYDLFVKHMAFFVRDEIDVGIEILPMKSLQSEMSSGPAYYEGALYDLIRNGRGVPAVPLVLVGVAV